MRVFQPILSTVHLLFRGWLLVLPVEFARFAVAELGKQFVIMPSARFPDLPPGLSEMISAGHAELLTDRVVMYSTPEER